MSTLLDADAVARLRHLVLAARQAAAGLLVGEHRSKRVGQAVEFADYREYVAGMDPRRIDWRVWGRSDRYVVRREVVETERPVVVLLDVSGDLGSDADAKGAARNKLDYALTMAATLSWWAQQRGDPVALGLIGGEGIEGRWLPPRRGRRHLEAILRSLVTLKPAGRADLHQRLVDVGDRIPRRSVVVLITDGMEEPARWLPALQTFGRRGADLRLVHLLSGPELRLEGAESALFYSPEGGDDLAVDPERLRDELAAVVVEWVAELQRGVTDAGGIYVGARTDRPFEPVFRSLARAVGLAGWP